MTEHAQFLVHLPVRAVLDGELVAFDDHGTPDFPLVCERVLHRHSTIPLVYIAFDVLSVDGHDLEQMQLAGPHWQTPQAFEDGAALSDAVCEHELEGVVAKRRTGRYLPGQVGWVKAKNRDYWRYELEREAMFKTTRPSARPKLTQTCL